MTTSKYIGTELEAMAEARNYSEWIASMLASVLHGEVAEVGAGLGSMSRQFLATPAVTHLSSYEPAADLANELRDTAEAHPKWSILGCEFPRDLQPSYDGIIYSNVLEHIRDDDKEIAAAVAALRPGGRIGIVVPALPWLMSDFDRSIGHHRRYTKRSLAGLFEGLPVETEAIRYFDFPGVLPWLVTMRLGRGTITAKRVRLYDRAAVPIVRRIESRVAIPIGKNLLLVARRKGEVPTES